MHIVTCQIEEHFYGLPLSAVERIATAVEATPLPDAPPSVQGIINVSGDLLPVYNTRRIIGLPERPVELSDRLIIARTPTRRMALLADAVDGVIERPDAEVSSAARLFGGLPRLKGVVKLEDGLLLILNLDAFLSIEEERALNAALAGAAK